MAAEAVATRRRIIPRPRLTRLLDESPARIKLLVAPAGYGKTTLAQQWFDRPERQAVWYRGGPASADVAALATGVASAVAQLVPDAGRRMRERVRATGNPEQDVEILADLFAEDIPNWPSGSWLVLDDYQFAMESAASEQFVDLITRATNAQMVITSRRRPSWATARRLLYGEIQEVDRRVLAMEEGEAETLLGRVDASVKSLVDGASGWPAVLGLAALADQAQVPRESVPHALYQYFAEEVFHAADAATQLDLARLALAQVVDEGLAEAILGEERGRQTLLDGIRLGVFVRDRDDGYSVHPLLRDFLESQLRLHHKETVDAARAQVAECLLAHERWDEAFELADRFGDLQLAETVLESALDPLIEEGRIPTIKRWLESRTALQGVSPVFDLAEAEAAFRLAEHAKAEALAAQAAKRLPPGHPLLSRAFARAGRSALIASRDFESLHYFTCAREHARTTSEIREALVGLYFAASELGLPEARSFLEELSRMDDKSLETTLRIGAAQVTDATRGRGMRDVVAEKKPLRYLAPKATDPLAATAFLHTLGNSLNLLARYDEAYEVINELLEITRKYRLDMPVPHALLNRALAQHGRREFMAAHASLEEVNTYVPPGGDDYLEFNAAAIRARLLTSERRLQEAAVAVEPAASEIRSLALRAEYLVSQALVHACLKETDRPRDLVAEALAVFGGSVEAKVIGACAIAIAEGESSSAFESAVHRIWDAASATGNLDGIVYGYRAYPPLLRALAGIEQARATVLELVIRAKDERLARRVGLRLREKPAHELLTQRETEVYEHLLRGLSNRAIAESLVVSEATVKVHLRHIYEKLGVKSRTEAVAQDLSP
jgi:LuxR family transcriptional regulator, maltose regulon positive regulatory protein